jgi:predicted nucleic acid-binding protein
MMIDTDVLISYFRGKEKAKKALDKLKSFNISVVVYLELLQGIKNRAEMIMLKKFVKAREVIIIPIDADISSRAIFFMEEYSLSHGLRMAEALIAATAHLYGQELFTGNYTDYKMIANLDLLRYRH